MVRMTLMLLLSSMLAPLTFPACSPDSNTTPTSHDVLNRPFFSIISYTVEDNVLIATVDTNNGERVVKIKPEEDGMTVLATIENSDSKILYEITANYDEEKDAMTLSEATETDRMTIDRTYTTKDVTEHFIQNDLELTVTYPRADEVAMMTSFDDYQQGRHDNIDPDLLLAFIQFDEFYNTDNSLHNNEEGKILVLTIEELLSSGQFEGFACDKCIDVWCGSVGFLTGLKCLFGAAGNVFCLLGTIVSLGCALFTIACAVGGC